MVGKVREKRHSCGNYTNISIYENVNDPVTRTRKRKTKMTKPSQQKLNSKRARLFFELLVKGNFKPTDYFVTLTYADEYVPKTVEKAEEEVKKYIRRLKRYSDIEVKHIFVTEITDENGEIVRVHHHLLLSGEVAYTEVKNKWAKGRGKNKKEIGFIKIQRIKNEAGLERVCKYMLKAPAGKRRWSASKNLKRPVEEKNDHKYSRSKLNKLGVSADIKHELVMLYPKHEILNVEVKYNDLLGYMIFAELKLKKEYRKE